MSIAKDIDGLKELNKLREKILKHFTKGFLLSQEVGDIKVRTDLFWYIPLSDSYDDYDSSGAYIHFGRTEGEVKDEGDSIRHIWRKKDFTMLELKDSNGVRYVIIVDNSKELVRERKLIKKR